MADSRFRRRCLAQLKRAESLRAGERITQQEYDLAALAICLRIDDGKQSPLWSFEGREVPTLEWIAMGILWKDEDPAYGDYRGAPIRIRDSFGAMVDPGRPTKDVALRWTPQLTPLVRSALRKTTHVGRLLGPPETILAAARRDYPNLFSATAAALGMIVTALLGFLFGRQSP